VSKTRYDDRRRKVHCHGHQSRTFLLCLFSFFSPEPQEIFNPKKKKKNKQTKASSTQALARYEKPIFVRFLQLPLHRAAPTHVQIFATTERSFLHLLLVPLSSQGSQAGASVV
jgi:hypothetical protein